MIPKVIHYCWFGNAPIPELAQRCIASWRKYCPDYEIKNWSEENFQIDCCEYVKEAYQAKKWAFITDYVRLYALTTEGGIYLDTDVEVIAPLDPYLDHRAFAGFESDNEISTGILACEKGFPLFGELLHDYDERHFRSIDGCLDLTTNVIVITDICKKHGFIPNNQFQDVDGLILYPKDTFCPKSYETGEINITEQTVTIHHFSGSWIPMEGKIAEKIKRKTSNKGMLIKIAGFILAFPFTYSCRVKDDGFLRATFYYMKRPFHWK